MGKTLIPVKVIRRVKIFGKIWDEGINDDPGMPEDLVASLEAEQELSGTPLVERREAKARAQDGLTDDQVDVLKAAIQTLKPGDLKDGVPKVAPVNKALKAAGQNFKVKAADITAVMASIAGGTNPEGNDDADPDGTGDGAQPAG